MKKIYIKPDIHIEEINMKTTLLVGSQDVVEEPGNQGIVIPSEDEDFDPSMSGSKGDEFDPWEYSFRDDLLW